MFSKDADMFFENPVVHRESPGKFGVLCRLRKDVYKCMGINPETKQNIPYSALWPGTIAIFAGIDLVAKFYVGSDKGSVGGRFKSFVERYFKLSRTDQETIYQLRNALMHSFGLYSETKDDRIYRFIVTQGQDQFIITEVNDLYYVDIRELHRKFESAIDQFQAELESSSSLQSSFTKLFPKYGAIFIGLK